MSSAWRNRDLVRKIRRTNIQVNQSQDQAGTSQILHTKLFQKQVVRKLLAVVFILFSLLLFPFYPSPFIISFSISMPCYFSPPSLFSFLFLVSRMLFIVVFIILNFSHSLLQSSSLLPILLLFTVLLFVLNFSPQYLHLLVFIFNITLIPGELSCRFEI
jgi:hypothetical protein